MKDRYRVRDIETEGEKERQRDKGTEKEVDGDRQL